MVENNYYIFSASYQSTPATMSYSKYTLVSLAVIMVLGKPYNYYHAELTGKAGAVMSYVSSRDAYNVPHITVVSLLDMENYRT